MKVAEVFDDLKAERRWVGWYRQDRGGKTTKPPVNPIPTPSGNYRRARARDAGTWGTYADAAAIRGRDVPIWVSKDAKEIFRIAGIGLQLGDGLAGIDIDHCRNAETGEISPDARAIVDALESYAEVSPSGDGLHVLFRMGETPRLTYNKRHLKPFLEGKPQELECYTEGRYFTVTGKAFEGARPIETRDAAFYDVARKYGLLETRPEGAGPPSPSPVGEDPGRTDDERWAEMLAWRNRGADVAALRGGNIGGYPSHSEADQALANYLAVVTENEPLTERDRLVVMTRMFEQTPLADREKWRRAYSDGTTYGERTLRRAIERYPRSSARDDFSQISDGPSVLPNGEYDPEDDPAARAMKEADDAALYAGLSIEEYWPTYCEHVADPARHTPTPAPWQSVNNILDGGFYPGALYIYGGTTGAGKTTFALQLGDYVAAQGRPVLMTALEMGTDELIAKSLSRLTHELGEETDFWGLSTREILRNTPHPVHDAARDYYRDTIAPHMFILEGVGDVSAAQIERAAYLVADKTGTAPLIIVDYLQILAPGDVRDTEKRATDKNLVAMKQLARSDLNTSVLVISSLNRESYKKSKSESSAARLSQTAFKESGGIEYGADYLFGLAAIGPYDHAGVSVAMPELKNRHGEPHKTPVEFVYYGGVNTFEEMLGPVDADDETPLSKDESAIAQTFWETA